MLPDRGESSLWIGAYLRLKKGKVNLGVFYTFELDAPIFFPKLLVIHFIVRVHHGLVTSHEIRNQPKSCPN